MTNASVNISNRFKVFENLCNVCNSERSVCQHTSLSSAGEETVCKNDKCENFDSLYNVSCLTYSSKINTTVVENRAKFENRNLKQNNVIGNKNAEHNECLNEVRIENSGPSTYRNTENIPRAETFQIKNNDLQLGLSDKGLNFGHLNIQGICGRDMSKFSEIKAILNVNKNLHVLGLSKTKLKDHKTNGTFHVEGYQTPFRKDNHSNGGGGIMVYVKHGINAKRREDLEINGISCIWLEISQNKGKSFLIGNMYRPPDSRVEYNDRFEDFIENASEEGKEIILLGDFNKNLYEDNLDREWQNLTLSLGLTQMISQPTRVTPSSKTLIDHFYTSNEDYISRVCVNKQTISDHYAIFGNRKCNCAVNRHSHQTITYRSFKHFDENAFINDLRQIPWEILESFDDVIEWVQIWNILFLEIVNKHAPLKQHRVRKENQPE